MKKRIVAVLVCFSLLISLAVWATPVSAAQSDWFSDKEPATGTEYSFVAVGDTQHLSQYHPTHMATLYDWIVNNIDDKKIKFVMGLGDIVQWYENDPTNEWKNAAAAIKKLDGKVPYSVCRGNHDGLSYFNTYFPYAEYKSTVGGTYDTTSIVNSWRKFEIHGIKYMLFTLNYSPDDNVLAWASNLIAQNPSYNVIITTHMYLNKNGTTLDASENYAPTASSGATNGPNNGDHIWNKLISKHDNIVLVMSGHIPSDNVVLTQTEGKNGTIVSQMLVDPSAGDTESNADGMVALLNFSNGGSRVTVEYYSTVKDQYYKAENQYSFDIHVVKDYTVNFENKTGKSYTMPSSITAKAGETITLPNVTATANGKLGYWTLREDGKYKRFEPGQSYVVNSNTTFYFVTPTIDLKLSASGQSGEVFVYQITATNFSLDVCVPVGQTITINDLPSNLSYTVTELTKHSWRYTTATSQVGGTTGGTSITVGVANAPSGVVTVSFTHSNRNSKWLTDCQSDAMTYVPSVVVSHAITDFSGGDPTKKQNIEVFNGCDTSIYVRVSITTHTIDASGNIAGNSSWALSPELYVREGDTKTYWVKHKDGFYYYTKPLAANNAENVAAGTHTAGKLFGSDFNFETNQRWTVSAQSIEATAAAARDLWGVVISEGSVTDV